MQVIKLHWPNSDMTVAERDRILNNHKSGNAMCYIHSTKRVPITENLL